MELFLKNHNYKYAVEQIMLLLFPGEKPLYPETPSGDFWAQVSLSRGKRYATATCKIRSGSGVFRGSARVRESLATDSFLQRIIKLSFYRAGLRLTGKKPPWGAVTGVRPGKLMSRYLDAGMADAAAIAEFTKEYDVSPERAQLCLQTAKYSSSISKNLALQDICLYVGIPFCPTRCAYCSFVSQSVERSAALIPEYMEALLLDVEKTAEAVRAAGLRVISLYIGGGTPTTLSGQQLTDLFSALYAGFDLSSCREITVEAGRPDTITSEKLEVLSRFGVTRISVNPQSMCDSVLQSIGRRHTSSDVLDAMALVRSNQGFTVNMDLIAGLPSDTFEGFEESLGKVLALRPENITVHTISLKKGSRIMLEGIRLPSDKEAARMVDSSRNALFSAGYVPYYLYRQKYMTGALENVGWCLKGQENIYNICIMDELCSIVAMGAGASTKLVAKSGEMQRRFAPKYPKEYIETIDRLLSEKNKIKEFYNGLLPE